MSCVIYKEEDEMKKMEIRKQWKELIVPYLFIIPFLCFFILFFIYPAINSFFISFTSYRGYGKVKWVGLENYSAILQYNVFWTEMKNTLMYWLLHVAIMIFFSFSMAYLVSQPSYAKLSKYKIVLFLPRVIAPTVAALIFRAVFSSTGLVNTIINANIPFLQNDFFTRCVIAFILVWRDFGYWFVVFLAGMTSVNPELVDAATVDGTNLWQRVIHIIIPQMQNILKFALIIDIISSIRLFSIPNIIIGQPGALSPTSISPIMNLLVQNIQQGNFGRASTVGWLLFFVVAILTIIQMVVVKDTEDL